jgi:surface protein
MVSIHFIFFSLVFVLLKRVKTTHVFESKAALKTAVDAWTSSATRASAESTYGYISSWDTSQVPDMSELFRDKSDFNDDISSWNVSSVDNMAYMFHGVSSFNGSLSSWDVSSVTTMVYMFRSASLFDGNLSSWDVSSVTTMAYMFYGASAFNDLQAKDLNAFRGFPCLL